MAVFQDVNLQWQGKEHTIKANSVMRVIAEVEQIISVAELAGKRPPVARIAEAYTMALSFVGVTVDQEEVYEALFDDGGAAIQGAVMGLIMLMVPPKKYQTKQANEQAVEDAKKPQEQVD